jgi:hypothetical protein
MRGDNWVGNVDVNVEPRKPRGPVLQYERLVIHRKLLAWIHVVLAFIVALVYLTQLDLSHFAYWRLGFGMGIILMLVPPLFPYLLSAIHSRRVVTVDRIRLAWFILVLLLGSVLMGLLLLGVFGSVGKVTLLVLFGCQTFIYMWAAEGLLHVE